MDKIECEKVLEASVYGKPTQCVVLPPGTPPDSHGEEPGKIPSRLWQEDVKVDIFKYTKNVFHNECLLFTKKDFIRALLHLGVRAIHSAGGLSRLPNSPKM